MLTIYKASAGSGKTFTLAYEYIKVLLGIKDRENRRYVLNSDKYSPSGHRIPGRHAALLAITFTNAATDEMKGRIIRQLDALSGRNPENTTPYTEMLVREFGCTVPELQEAAAKALSELLFDFNSFNVSTIDSFFQTVLRTFSREIDHQGDYELSLNPEDAIRQAMALTLDELNYTSTAESERMLAWIETLVMDNMAAGQSYNFFNRSGSLLNGLAKAMKFAMNEEYYAGADAIEAYLENPARIQAFRRELTSRINTVYAPAREAARKLKAFSRAIGADTSIFKSIGSRIDATAAGLKLKNSDLNVKAFKEPVFDLPSFFTKATLTQYGEGILSGSLPDIEAFCTELPKAVRMQAFYKSLVSAVDFLEFLGIARKKLEEYLRESNQVLISDTGELLSRIISDVEMPFIYERMGMKLTNLLIDEFQDTSRMQWHNLKPLVGNSLAYDNDCLIIGDEKQAIYRFRNSDSEILGSQVQTVDFPDKHILRGHTEKDNTNHRSAGDIVRFNNALFSNIDLDKEHYANVVQGIDPRLDKLGAYIKLHFSKNDNVVAVLEETAADIRRQHDAGYKWRDIMILVRTKSEAKAVVDFMTTVHPDIELLSSEALLLSSSASVRAIVSMLKLISRSYSGKKATKGDNAPVYASRSDIALMITRFNHYSSDGVPDDDALRMALSESTEASEPLKAGVGKIRGENPANLVALIEAVIAHRLSPEMRHNEYAYIAAFQDLAIKHLESADPSLAAFLAAYDRNESEWAIKAPADLDAVQVMTVHRSKGLERPCIHLPFADWELYHSTNSLWVPAAGLAEKYGFDPEIVPPMLRVDVSDGSPLMDEGLSPFYATIAADRKAEVIDNLNVTYVAFTRASRELIAHVRMCRNERYISQMLAGAFKKIIDNGSLPFTLVTAAPDDAPPEMAEDEKYYILGTPTVPVVTDGTDASILPADEYKVVFRDDTRELVSIDDILASDDEIGDEQSKEIVDPVRPFAGTPEMLEAGRRGTNLHAVLASMETLADFDRALGRMAVRMAVGEEEAGEYRAELERAFENAGEIARIWFDPENEVYAERSFYDASSDETMRPDRIVLRPDGSVMIVDYKFTSEARASHRRQVADYKRVVAALGYDKTEAFLWYPLLDKIIKV